MNTIKDIAKKCHVSISTVSRALNGYSDINKDTKELVLKTADELDYIPNKNARDLVKKNNNHIAIIIKELNEEFNPFQILSGLYDYVEILDYEVSLFTLGKSIKNGKSYYKFCKENNISGALLYGMEANDPYVKELIDKKFPIVLVDCDLEGEKVVNIGIDNFRVAYEVTNYMIKKGCKKIKTIQGKRSLYITKQRVRGYEQALRDNGIEINSDNIIYGEFSKQFGEKIVKSIIEYKNVDGIFCASDNIAIGVYEGLKRLNIKIPDEISIVGCGDNEISRYLTPSLTTIKQNTYNIGYNGAALLDKLIKNESVEKYVRLDYKFIERSSVI
ncbi:LacI family DNA-binding transcriptional regulator [Clostridium gasigenes]|uniref:Transcriptional regulator, LacI family n=1 Tax=Clostridium gasigenes TaxID=94869 RepID=A0A1H0QPU7_9CLOT|nr:LacI family DNA-binding transcriptional regulator [Clostridium gasigenes]MBB6625144.1 LacI family DNA-binding transcriptional regulator [Clostridium gasigenes]MBU3133861.1 LacI family transcriptional regulator [Clostridium gasigenes]NKF06746.1 LacI family transcriptional regulator [Clostridium gasigenes]QSW20907.1 LacI family DNA-binding transcriptional regulator [Clostridium gasigenes]SDP19377.1 transcriptional regulator, LacI family [Clostridium gasigenes]